MHRIFLILFVLISACGGSPGDNKGLQHPENKEQITLDADSMVPRTVLVRADLATQVDRKRYRPLLPPSRDFDAGEPIIYLVGKLKKVPFNSHIQVKWFIDASPKALLVSSIEGSDRYQFLASFEPPEKKFVRGAYTARIYVNEEEVGAVPFLIYDDTHNTQGPTIRNIQFSTKIKRKEKPIKPKSHFPNGMERIFVTFDLKGADFDDVMEIKWFRGTEQFHTEDVVVSGDKRYASYVVSFPNLPAGDYRVEISMGQTILGAQGFLIGKKTSGPLVNEIRLGKEVGDDNMPIHSLRRFRRTDQIIYCGLNFIDLDPESMVEIQWAQVAGREHVILATQKTIIQSGGTGSYGTAWESEVPLKKGKYIITVTVDGEQGGEKEFEVR